ACRLALQKNTCGLRLVNAPAADANSTRAAAAVSGIPRSGLKVRMLTSLSSAERLHSGPGASHVRLGEQCTSGESRATTYDSESPAEKGVGTNFRLQSISCLTAVQRLITHSDRRRLGRWVRRPVHHRCG